MNPHLDQFTSASRTTALPLGLHGDDAQYVKHGKLLLISLNGPLCRSKHSRLIVSALDFRALPIPHSGPPDLVGLGLGHGN